MSVCDIMFALLRVEICQAQLSEKTKEEITADVLPLLFNLSKKHDIAHLIADVLDRHGLLEQSQIAKKHFIRERSMAVFRVEQLKYDCKNVFDALEQLQIDYVPLKGTVIRNYYSEDWMRTSADVDILVHRDQLEDIINVLEQKLGYTLNGVGAYDAVVVSPNGFHIELHFNLISENDNPKASEVLGNVWQYTQKEGDGHCLSMREDYFYFYHLAHMARHFVDGGCGIRPYIDLWLMNKKIKFDVDKIYELLEIGGLLKFAKASETLSKAWMEDLTMDKETLSLQDYILGGGVYGNKENKIAMHQGKQGSRFKYIMSRIFMPVQEMQYRYPVLKKHKWLYPFMVIRRCFEVVFKGDTKRIKAELKTSSELVGESASQTVDMIEYLGLK